MIKAAILFLVAFGLGISMNAQVSPSRGDLPRCAESPERELPLPEHMIRPKYPKDALNRGIGKTVDIRAVIAPDARTKELTPLADDSEFSRNAVEAIRRWQFHPVSDKGRSVETTYKVHVRFNPLLQEANSDVELESPQPEPPATELGRVPPKVMYQPEPEFSEASRKKGEHGNVEISLVVDSDGLPHDLKILCSTIPDSNQNAIEAVRQWKFSPATKDGKPVAAAIEVEVLFKQY